MMSSTTDPNEAGVAERLAEIIREIEKLHLKQDLQTQHCRDILLLSLVAREGEKRKELSRHTKMLIRNVTADEPFNSRCPCCLARDVLSEGKTAEHAQFDHFYGPALNRPQFAWLICGRCHHDLGVCPTMRISVTPKFHHFQSHILDQLARSPGISLALP
jgi:hypothetical protein